MVIPHRENLIHVPEKGKDLHFHINSLSSPSTVDISFVER